ncbi:hypothetical protein [Streptococcus sanguinis]|jgi:hypothetical protein|uniref:hypothetical protein n=1 Tax=Streptococcus sanguinis TaxID=1305 RepID=UPI000F69269C|nr:hypothetical protein [Streptococcus sanguinis]MCY7018223.1 hypothetical protein [Streptococcus sanguinis]RSI11420.1 hypothetical protein D8889_05040 [Streptococcus sanguinis]RSI16021.1 hypothetical protein D8884_10480 [Streptococcus sanguinis]
MKVDELIGELQKKDLSVIQSETSKSGYISLECVTNKGKNRKFLELPKNNNEDITWLKCHIDTILPAMDDTRPTKDGAPINRQVYFDNKIGDEKIINIAVASYNKVKNLY